MSSSIGRNTRTVATQTNQFGSDFNAQQFYNEVLLSNKQRASIDPLHRALDDVEKALAVLVMNASSEPQQQGYLARFRRVEDIRRMFAMGDTNGAWAAYRALFVNGERPVTAFTNTTPPPGLSRPGRTTSVLMNRYMP